MGVHIFVQKMVFQGAMPSTQPRQFQGVFTECVALASVSSRTHRTSGSVMLDRPGTQQCLQSLGIQVRPQKVLGPSKPT